MAKRTVTESQKKFIAAQQKYKCANIPNSNNIIGYNCPFWLIPDNEGVFDVSGYDIDHITEHSITHDDTNKNLQALCICCHRVKTIMFNQQKKLEISNKKLIEKSNKKLRKINEIINEIIDNPIYKEVINEISNTIK